MKIFELSRNNDRRQWGTPNYIMVKLNMIIMVNNSWTCSNIMNLLNSNENATEWYMNKKKLIITL